MVTMEISSCLQFNEFMFGIPSSSFSLHFFLRQIRLIEKFWISYRSKEHRGVENGFTNSFKLAFLTFVNIPSILNPWLRVDNWWYFHLRTVVVISLSLYVFILFRWFFFQRSSILSAQADTCTLFRSHTDIPCFYPDDVKKSVFF